ncbi:ABC transporter substrate-binding protein [Sulfuriferula sp.]|uniref:ABC transporter substrate-binding protein n=1 Tax=Sulfuriferula sp. TaxID=2025307 RepID=UPI0027314787|nr:ABC transporter substrate-binding protein [Sulfuriferula sp.]MDP2024748.1 ABC transporter substrate-binding protein [Sulfuriferula sp.]
MNVNHRLGHLLVALTLCFGLLARMSAAHAEISVGFSDWPGTEAWYAAEQQGYFKKHGADVKLVRFSNSTDSISVFFTGKLDANSQTWSDALAHLAKGIPLKVVLLDHNSTVINALMIGSTRSNARRST